MLKKYFNFNHFRPGQQEIITDVLKRKNVLGILPTGSGKSICYQLPAILMDGLTVVVSPLISLMIDQVKELKAMNFKRVVAINSLVDYDERQTIFRNLQQYKLLFISPELLQQERVIQHIARENVSLFVIDEAHCISQWGHDFRPDYLKLGSIINRLNHPPVLALSATATPNVQEDIIRNLHLESMSKHIYPMDRNNLTFVVEKVVHPQEKLEWVTTYLEQLQGPTLIYFSSRNQAEKMARILSSKLSSLKIAFYHGGLEPMDRIQIQQQFMNQQIDVICCTSAFGMGINKQDIRLIIHYHLPSQIEDYIQEVGRAGRDGNPSLCLLLYASSDIAIPMHLIESELPQSNEIQFVMKQLKELYIQGIELSEREQNEFYQRFPISEIKWRFLRFHFEKHGMIMENTIMYESSKWQFVYHHLIEWINTRNIHKKRELQEMVDWALSENCLRNGLYKKFQSGYKAPIFQCCSNCGADLKEWVPDEKKERKIDQTNWRGKLYKLLVGSI